MAKFTETLKHLYNSGIDGYKKYKTAYDFSKPDPRKYNKKAFFNTFEQIPRDDAKDFYSRLTGYQMTKKAGVMGSIGVVGAIAGSAALSIDHNANLSNVRGEQLANTINHNVSPGLDLMLEENNEEKLNKSFNANQYGVEPNIVFALHELRN